MPSFVVEHRRYENHLLPSVQTLAGMLSIAYLCCRRYTTTCKIGPLLGHDLTRIRYEDQEKRRF